MKSDSFVFAFLYSVFNAIYQKKILMCILWGLPHYCFSKLVSALEEASIKKRQRTKASTITSSLDHHVPSCAVPVQSIHFMLLRLHTANGEWIMLFHASWTLTTSNHKTPMSIFLSKTTLQQFNLLRKNVILISMGIKNL